MMKKGLGGFQSEMEFGQTNRDLSHPMESTNNFFVARPSK